MDLLHIRAQGFSWRSRWILSVTAISLIIVAYLWVSFYMAIRQFVNTLEAASERLRTGTVEESFELPNRDELGAVVNSFNSITKALIESEEKRIEAQKEQAKLQEEIINRQAMAIEALSTPLIPLYEGVVVIPFVGELDSQRLESIEKDLVGKLHSSGARVAIIDITGVPNIDEKVAFGLIKTAKAAHLLGVKVIVTGMQPEAAREITRTNVEFDGIVTVRCAMNLATEHLARQTGSS
jgi:anti-anti-sigma regulatory factor